MLVTQSTIRLKQAPCAWYSRLSDRLLELEFVSSCSNSSLFIRCTPQHTTYVLIYVDDICITSSFPQGTATLLHSLCVDFAIKDLGLLHFLLGIETIPTPNVIILLQQHYPSLQEQHARSQVCQVPHVINTRFLFFPMIHSLIHPSTATLLVPCSIYHLLIPTSHLLSTKPLNSCTGPPPSICKLWST